MSTSSILHIGKPPAEFDGWEETTLFVHNFKELSYHNEAIISSSFRCFGHLWQLKVFPGGDEDIDVDDGDDPPIVVHLINLSPSEVVIDWKISLLKNIVGWYCLAKETEDLMGDPLDMRCGERNECGMRRAEDSITRSQVLRQFLDGGSLVVKVSIRLSDAKSYGNAIRSQYSSAYSNIGAYLDEETADIAFDVKGVSFVAHKVIIKTHAKDLYVMCESANKSNPMLINDVDPEIFRIMLRSLYGGFIVPEEWEKHSPAILQAAAKYGFLLKDEAEVWCAATFKFTVENVVDEFLKADGSNYAVVREAAKKFMAQHGEEILASDSFERLHESLPLMREVMSAVIENSKKRKSMDE